MHTWKNEWLNVYIQDLNKFKQNLSFPRTAERHEGWRFGMPLEDAWGYVG